MEWHRTANLCCGHQFLLAFFVFITSFVLQVHKLIQGSAKKMSTVSPADNNRNDGGLLKACQSAYEAAKKYAIIDIAAHPFIYADLLIRIGYEPFPPVEERSVWTFYKSKLILPGVVPYARYLIFTDTPRVCRTFGPAFAETLLKKQMIQCLEGCNNNSANADDPPPDTPQLLQRLTIENLLQFIETRSKQLAFTMGVTIVSHPFRVITIRYMASFVDQNPNFSDLYSTILNSIKTHGIFAGLIPRLLADFIYALASATIYMSTVEFLQEIDIQRYLMPNHLEVLDKVAVFISNYIANSYCFQFRTVSDIMIVNGTSLALGNPPFMPIYKDGWFDCWKNIPSERLYKSVSIFKRVYQGPITWDKGRPIPIIGVDHFGPTYFSSGIIISRPDQASSSTVPYLLKEFYAQ